MCYLCSENKGAEQLCGYRAADLCLCFFAYSIKQVSLDMSHLLFKSSFAGFIHRSRHAKSGTGTRDNARSCAQTSLGSRLIQLLQCTSEEIEIGLP